MTVSVKNMAQHFFAIKRIAPTVVVVWLFLKIWGFSSKYQRNLYPVSPFLVVLASKV